MTFNGKTQTWVQMIPTNYVSGNAMVIGLHGSGETGALRTGGSLSAFSSAGPGYIYLAPNAHADTRGNWEIDDASGLTNQCGNS